MPKSKSKPLPVRDPDHFLAKSLSRLIGEYETTNECQLSALKINIFIFKDSKDDSQLLLLKPAERADTNTPNQYSTPKKVVSASSSRPEWTIPTHTIALEEAGHYTMHSQIRSIVLSMLRGGIWEGWLEELQFGDWPFTFPYTEHRGEELQLCVNMTVKPEQMYDPVRNGAEDICPLIPGQKLNITIDRYSPGEYSECRWEEYEEQIYSALQGQVSKRLIRGCCERDRKGRRDWLLSYWKTKENIRSVIRDMLSTCLLVREIELDDEVEYVIVCQWASARQGLFCFVVPQERVDEAKRCRSVLTEEEGELPAKYFALWHGRKEVGVNFQRGGWPHDEEGLNLEWIGDFIYGGHGGRLVVEWVGEEGDVVLQDW